jgi:hypothetical protein
VTVLEHDHTPKSQRLSFKSPLQQNRHNASFAALQNVHFLGPSTLPSTILRAAAKASSGVAHASAAPSRSPSPKLQIQAPSEPQLPKSISKMS